MVSLWWQSFTGHNAGAARPYWKNMPSAENWLNRIYLWWHRWTETALLCSNLRVTSLPSTRGKAGTHPIWENVTDLEVLARAIARIHAVGAVHDFQHRVALTSQRMGHDSRDYLLQQSFIPDDVIPAYDSVTQDLLALIDQRMLNVPMQRIHGDCHMGNVLWRDQTPHFVDFDDCMMGPPIQDLWMLLSGDRAEQTQQLSIILDAYIPFCDFAVETLALIEVLRTLRIMYHAAWIARRWQDPAFPAAFTWFDSPRYWSEHLLSLREQQALLSEPPLVYL